MLVYDDKMWRRCGERGRANWLGWACNWPDWTGCVYIHNLTIKLATPCACPSFVLPARPPPISLSLSFTSPILKLAIQNVSIVHPTWTGFFFYETDTGCLSDHRILLSLQLELIIPVLITHRSDLPGRCIAALVGHFLGDALGAPLHGQVNMDLNDEFWLKADAELSSSFLFQNIQVFECYCRMKFCLVHVPSSNLYFLNHLTMLEIHDIPWIESPLESWCTWSTLSVLSQCYKRWKSSVVRFSFIVFTRLFVLQLW